MFRRVLCLGATLRFGAKTVAPSVCLALSSCFTPLFAASQTPPNAVPATAAPAQASTPLQQGMDLYRQRKYNEAIQLLEPAIQKAQPGTTEYLESVTALGQSYYMLSKNDQAIPWLEKAPPATEVLYMLGYAYLRTGKTPQSVVAFAGLFHVDSASAGAHVIAAQMMIKQEYEAQAVEQLKLALQADPRLPQTHFLLGEIAIYRGRLDEAIQELQEERQINPTSSQVYYKLGDAFTRKEQWDLAVPQLQRSIWLNPDFSGPYILLGKCFFKKNDWGNAEGSLRRALKLDPQNYSATYLLGQTLVAAGRTAEGKAMLEKSQALPR